MQREADSVEHDRATGGLGLRVGRLATGIAALTGWRRWATAAVAGALSVLSIAPFFLWPILLVTLPVLVWLIDAAPRRAAASGGALFDLDRRRLWQAALVGWLFGYTFHVLGLYWLREAFLVTGGGLALLWPLGVLGLPAYLALFHGAAAAFAVAIPGGPMTRVVALALGLSASEWLRGHVLTGFPWNVLGLALTGSEWSMQASAVIGMYGLTLVAVVVLAGPVVLVAAAVRQGRDVPRASTLAVLLAAVPMALIHGYGAWRMSAPPPADVAGVRLRLVQPSIPQREKWQAELQLDFMRRHIELSLTNAKGERDGLAGITHVIWPEAAMPFLPLQRPQVLDMIGEALPDGVQLLAGVLRMERAVRPEAEGGGEDRRVYNSLVVFADDGGPVAIYDKTHLVPFGEYLPYPGLLEGIGLQSLTRQRGGFSIGPEPRPLLQAAGLPPAGPLICYEAVFPGSTRASAGRPAFLLNVTNDGWFGNSTGPRQHLHQARMRSVEEGLPLIRVANNGITAAFDAYGREIARIGLDVAGVIDTGLPGQIAPPVYARLGDLPFWVAWVIGLAMIGGRRNRT